MRNYPKKITTKMIGLDHVALSAVVEKEKSATPIPVMRVYGNLRDHEVTTNTFGDSMRFRGEFEAVNLLTGAVYRSRALFVPETAEAILADMLTNAEENTTVQFGLDISVVYNAASVAKGGRPYSYEVKNLIETDADSDPLSQLGAALSTALPKPKPEAKAVKEESNGKKAKK